MTRIGNIINVTNVGHWSKKPSTGVVDGEGHQQAFDLVASNADVVHTYYKLLGV